MNFLKTLVAAAITTSCLPGCVGIGVVHPKTTELTSFSLSSIDKTVKPLAASTPPSKKEVLAVLGKPDSITSSAPSEEIWHYRNGFSWVGIVPMLVIPIPLVLPLVPSNTDIYFVGEISTKAEYSSTAWSGGCFCPENEGNMKYGFHSLK